MNVAGVQIACQSKLPEKDAGRSCALVRGRRAEWDSWHRACMHARSIPSPFHVQAANLRVREEKMHIATVMCRLQADWVQVCVFVRQLTGRSASQGGKRPATRMRGVGSFGDLVREYTLHSRRDYEKCGTLIPFFEVLPLLLGIILPI